MTEGWAPDDRPPLREPDRFVYDGLSVPRTEFLQRPECKTLVQQGLRRLVAGKVEVRAAGALETLEGLIAAVNTVWGAYARRGKEAPPVVLWQREAGQAVYANTLPEQTPGLFGGGPNQLLASPGAFYELSARILAAGLSPRMIALANEGWGVNPELPQARIEALEAERLRGRLRLGNLPRAERCEMWSVYAQRLDPAPHGEDAVRMYHIVEDPKRRLVPIEAGAEIKLRFAPLLAGTTSTHALND